VVGEGAFYPGVYAMHTTERRSAMEEEKGERKKRPKKQGD
jgi:hypothetical protein